MTCFKNKLIFFKILILSFISTIAYSQGQDTATQKQSAFYDAIVLYYALHNCNAFPLRKTPDDNSSASAPASATMQGPPATTKKTGVKNSVPGSPTIDSLQPSPDASLDTTQLYTIIESSTGKILADNILEKDLYKTLIVDTFPNKDERNSLVQEVLARNAKDTQALSSATDSTLNIVKKLYANNNYFDTLSKSSSLENSKSNWYKMNTSPIPLSGGSLGTLDNLVINGLTDYLVSQVNAEISESFFIRLKQILSKDSDLAILFPQTLASLTKINITQYTQAITTIKSAYQQDISQLLQHIAGLAAIKKYRDTLALPEYAPLTLVFAACDIVSMLKQGLQPAEILSRLENARYVAGLQNKNNYAATLATASLLSNSLRDVHIGTENAQNSKWILPSEINALMLDSNLFKLYMCLLTQQALADSICFSYNKDTTIKVKDSTTKSTVKYSFPLAKLLNDNSNNNKATSAQFLVYNFENSYNQLAALVKNFKAAQIMSSQATGALAQVSNYTTLYSGIAMQLVSFAGNVLDILPSTAVKKPKAIIDSIKTKYLPILLQINDVVTALEDKNYNLAVFKVDTILEKILVLHQN